MTSKRPLDMLKSNMTSRGLSIRKHGLHAYLIPNKLFEQCDLLNPTEKRLVQDLRASPGLHSGEFSLSVDLSQAGVQKIDDEETLLYEPSICIQIGPLQTSISLVDCENVGFILSSLRHTPHISVGEDQLDQLQLRLDTYTDQIESRLNWGIDVSEMRILALQVIARESKKYERFKKEKEDTLLTDPLQSYERDYIASLKQQYEVDLKRFRVMSSAFEQQDTIARAYFGITIRKYGSYSIRFKIKLG